MTIVDYRNYYEVDILFDHRYLVKNIEYSQFKRGTLVNNMLPTVYDHGYIGYGKYKVSVDGKHTPQYIAWKSMLNRCYGERFHKISPTYSDCVVCNDWLNYQNFAKWYDDNFYVIEDEKMALDKDILTKGNKIYSPQNCVYVPTIINLLFTKRQKLRGKFPVGVSLSKNRKSYEAWSGNSKKRVYLGSYDTAYKAFSTYKNYKENIIKIVANHYKDLIPTSLFEAMIKYEVDIND